MNYNYVIKLRECGGYQTAPKIWYGEYQDTNYKILKVNKTFHSHILTYSQVSDPANELDSMFPIPQDSLKRLDRKRKQCI